MANKQYTDQFKRDAVKLMTEQGYSLSKANVAVTRSRPTAFAPTFARSYCSSIAEWAEETIRSAAVIVFTLARMKALVSNSRAFTIVPLSYDTHWKSGIAPSAIASVTRCHI